MSSPKCQTPGCTGELKFMNAVEIYPTLIDFWRCEKCFMTHQFHYSGPYFVAAYYDPLRLAPLSGQGLWSYFECYKDGELKIMVAKKGPYATDENLEAMGYTVVYKGLEKDKLPGYRLYEIK